MWDLEAMPHDHEDERDERDRVRERERDRDTRETHRVEEQTRFLETRIRNLENEQIRLASSLDHEQSALRETLRQYKTVIESNTKILMGDGEKDGLVAWKNNMERRYKLVLITFGAIGTALLELIRNRIAELLR